MSFYLELIDLQRFLADRSGPSFATIAVPCESGGDSSWLWQALAISVVVASLSVGAETAHAQTFQTGQTVTLARGFVGCTDRDTSERILKLVAEGDTTAAAKLAQRERCISLSGGARATIKENSVWSHFACLRPQGEPDCYWFPWPFLK